jgi:CRP/FNR family cyclic AMP-dependent transcriptional regulator
MRLGCERGGRPLLSHQEKVSLSIEDMLARVPIFVALSKEQLGTLARLVAHRTFPRGTVIIRENDTDAALYIILKGQVSVVKKGLEGQPDIKLATLEEGDFFGEMALLDGAPRSASVTALTPTECLLLTRWVFYTTLRSDPEIAVAMLPTLSKRVRDAEEVTARIATT